MRQAIVKEHGCEFDKYMQWLKTIHQDDSWTVGGNRGHYLQIDLVSTEDENQVQVDWGIIGSGKVGNNQSAFWWRFIRENHVLKNDFTFSLSLEDLIYFLTYRPNNSHSSDFVNFAFGMSEGGRDWKHDPEALEFSLWSERSLYSYYHKAAEDCLRFFDRLSPHLCFLTKDYFWKFSVLRVLMLRSVATGVGMRISGHMTLGGIVDTIDFDDAQRYWQPFSFRIDQINDGSYNGDAIRRTQANASRLPHIKTKGTIKETVHDDGFDGDRLLCVIFSHESTAAIKNLNSAAAFANWFSRFTDDDGKSIHSEATSSDDTSILQMIRGKNDHTENRIIDFYDHWGTATFPWHLASNHHMYARDHFDWRSFKMLVNAVSALNEKALLAVYFHCNYCFLCHNKYSCCFQLMYKK